MEPGIIGGLLIAGMAVLVWFGTVEQMDQLKADAVGKDLLVEDLQEKLEEAEQELRQLRSWRRLAQVSISSMRVRLVNIEKSSMLRQRSFRVWRERFFPGEPETVQEEAEWLLLGTILRFRIDMDDIKEDDDSWPGKNL